MRGVLVRRILLVLVLLSVAAYLVWSFLPDRPAAALARAQYSYERLDAALEAADFSAAESARADLESRIAALQRVLEKSKVNDAQFRTWKGELFCLKARLLRDAAYVAAGVQGKPLPETPDTSTGGRYRNYTYIPDLDERRDSVLLLRNSASLLPDDPDVLTDALRMELSLRPIDWSQVKALSEATLQLTPDDQRALYLLARIDFEQPPPDINIAVSDPAKRDADRVARSLEMVRRLEKLPGIPIWRMIHLEAKIHAWKRDAALRRRDAAAANAARAALDETLWGANSAIRRAIAGEGIVENMSPYDVDGVLSLFSIAAQQTLTSDSPDRSAKAAAIGRDAADFTRRQFDRNDPQFSPAVLAANGLELLLLLRPSLAPDDLKDWTPLLERFREQWRPVVEDGRMPIALIPPASELFLLEARQGAADAARAEFWTKEAHVWVDDSLKLAEKNKVSGDLQYPLHFAAAYLALLGKTPSDAGPHLKALAAARGQDVRRAGFVLESLADVEAGRLKDALEKLDQLPRQVPREIAARTEAIRAVVYRGQGNIDRLLPILRHLQDLLAEPEKLSPGDQLWLMHCGLSRETVILQMAETHLNLARDRVARHLRAKPGQPVGDLTEFHDREVEALSRKLAPGGKALAQLRQLECLYAHALGRASRLDSLLASMRKTPSERFAALAVSEFLAARSADPRDAADLQRSLADQLAADKDDQAARLALALLLAQRGDTAKAADALASFQANSLVAGDLLLPEQADELARLARKSKRGDLQPILRALLQSAATRSPTDSRIELGLGEAFAADPTAKMQAVWHLQRAIHLAQANASLTAVERDQIVANANASLTSMPTSIKTP